MINKQTVLIILGILGISLLVREVFPKKETVIQPPLITTKYDTVQSVPKWLTDSLKKLERRKATRDTVEVIITNTIYDTTFVNVSSDSTLRPKVWPIHSYIGGTKYGDTAVVNTFSLRSGQGATSKVYITGILTGILMDTSSIPKLIFEPFPKPKKPPIKGYIIGGLVGLGACAILK